MKRIAIVGSGVSGLVAARLLHSDHDVRVFEAEPRIGGHVHTVSVSIGGRAYDVDTGFIVFNERTYPRFCRLLERLGVSSRATEMGFSVRCEATGLEYAGGSLDGLFAQRRNIVSPGFLRMLADVFRFWRDARRLIDAPDPKVTLGAFLDARGYSRAFVEQHLLPMGAAIWSTDARRMREFPALAFASFFENHGLLQLRDRPVWRVIEGGSRRYVEALVAPFRDRIQVGTPVRHIRRGAREVELETANGTRHRFDEVVLAVHSDQALALLSDPSPAEREVLGAVRYQRNEAVLHTDPGLLPRRRRAWASWNYHLPREPLDGVALTYHMNRLQGLDAPVELCVTLNRSGAIDPARVVRRLVYEHPVFDLAAIEARAHRAAVSGVRRTHYCGAWWYDGFHEDGVRSACDVAACFGVDGP